MEKRDGERGSKAPVHVLVLPFPAHGHLNPMLQFAKRLASKGLKVTLAPTIHTTKSTKINGGPVSIEPISDGCDERGFEGISDIRIYLERLRTAGSQSLIKIIEKHQHSSMIPIGYLVYNSFLPWALDVAQKSGLRGAVFFTHSCAVDAIYYHVHQGLLDLPVTASPVSLPGLPVLETSELPSLVSRPEQYPVVLDLLVNQLSNLNRVDWVLLNTFDKLEEEVVRWMAGVWRCKTIGPTVPSAYMDKCNEGDATYGINVHADQDDVCMNWLNTRETGSVVYISFGTIAQLGPEQMEELAWSLKGCNYYFLWVMRASEENKLPNKFKEETQDKGLIVKWCPQLRVLVHHAIGSFVTHCGWNSTLEALSLGVPMVGVPQWTDQPTNAMYVEEVWKVGLRPRVDDNGIVRRVEMEHCIKEVMEGVRSKDMRRNANKWKELAKEALSPGGSSYEHIEEFVAALSND